MRLEKWMADHCVNLRSFCRKAGVTPSTIYRVLKSKKSITLENAHKISKATNFEVELHDLLPHE